MHPVLHFLSVQQVNQSGHIALHPPHPQTDKQIYQPHQPVRVLIQAEKITEQDGGVHQHNDVNQQGIANKENIYAVRIILSTKMLRQLQT